MAWDFKSIAIVGSGAIGLYYGGRLALAGEDVKFLLRSDFDEISKHGLRVESSAGDFELPHVQAYRRPEDIGPVDLVMVCWKATANDQLAKILPPLLHGNTQVLTLQNGLGNCEAIAAITGRERVLGGLCFVCINRLSSGRVSHTAGGKIAIGEFSEGLKGRAAEISRRFQAAEIPASAVDDLQRAQWEKLIWNIPFNGLAVAEGGVTTDVLLENPVIEAEIRKLMNEVVDAANAQGLGVDRALVDWNIERTKAMDAYKPSTMIDFVEGRELELGPIWEEPLRRAKLAGVETPALENLLERMKAKVAARNSHSPNG
jgi:2-dehydropantoate 2-reductase